MNIYNAMPIYGNNPLLWPTKGEGTFESELRRFCTQLWKVPFVVQEENETIGIVPHVWKTSLSRNRYGPGSFYIISSLPQVYYYYPKVGMYITNRETIFYTDIIATLQCPLTVSQLFRSHQNLLSVLDPLSSRFGFQKIPNEPYGLCLSVVDTSFSGLYRWHGEASILRFASGTNAVCTLSLANARRKICASRSQGHEDLKTFKDVDGDEGCLSDIAQVVSGSLLNSARPTERHPNVAQTQDREEEEGIEASQDLRSNQPNASLVSANTTIDYPGRRRTVFIAHAGEDKENFAVPLREGLRKAGISVFLDKNMLPGAHIPTEVMTAAERAEIALLILSPQFFARKWPLTELGIFLRRRRYTSGLDAIHRQPLIIPIFHRWKAEDCDEGDFHRSKAAGRVFLDEGALDAAHLKTFPHELVMSYMCEVKKLKGITTDERALCSWFGPWLGRWWYGCPIEQVLGEVLPEALKREKAKRGTSD